MNSLLTDSFKAILKNAQHLSYQLLFALQKDRVRNIFSRDKVSGSCLFTIPNKQGKNQKPVLCPKGQKEELLKEGLLKLDLLYA